MYCILDENDEDDETWISQEKIDHESNVEKGRYCEIRIMKVIMLCIKRRKENYPTEYLRIVVADVHSSHRHLIRVSDGVNNRNNQFYYFKSYNYCRVAM